MLIDFYLMKKFPPRTNEFIIEAEIVPEIHCIQKVYQNMGWLTIGSISKVRFPSSIITIKLQLSFTR